MKYIYIFIIIIIGGFILFYQNIKTINNPNSILVVVNKNNQLPDNFIPKNLEKISLKNSNKDKYLVKEARINFEKLSNDAAKKHLSIIAVSTYRNYQYQENLFSNYIKEKGLEHTLKYSAKPGHSEHQTGLAVDVMGSNKDYNLFENTKEFKWMINNCYKYGFILRYPKGKENITGFSYEPWHYRYVGKKVAKYIYKNNLTLEEFIIKRKH